MKKRLRELWSGAVARHGRTTLILLAVIITVGLGLRAERVVNPNADPGDDARAYFALSKALYEDGSYGGPEFRDSSDWSPGAPLLYATAFAATGGAREGTARVVEAILGVLAILVAYLLGRRIACGPAGLIAAAGVAVYPPFIHSTGAMLSEPPAIFTLPAGILAFLWAADRRGTWEWTVPGLLLGLTALIRPEYALPAGLLAVAALWVVWRRTGPRPALLATGALVAAMLVPIVPWTVRNAIVLDRAVPISTGGGKALYVGTYLPADGEYQRVKAALVERFEGRILEPGSEELDRVNPTPLFDRIAERYPDLPRDEALGKAGREQFWDYVGDQPLDYGAMTARKVWRVWSSGVGEAMESGPGRVVQVILVLLGLAGLFLLVRRGHLLEAAVFAIPIAAVTFVGAVSLASNRRSEVLMTLVFPLAGAVLARAGRNLSLSRSEAPAPP
ncbi:MAG TPA: glycosyltransferase family 39 protein [Solirubrobacterales bacterium]|nr:glycosyltransferase family 39 protein [Solirubrobacterales bacterium]